MPRAILLAVASSLAFLSATRPLSITYPRIGLEPPSALRTRALFLSHSAGDHRLSLHDPARSRRRVISAEHPRVIFRERCSADTTGDRKRSPSPGSSRVKKGAANASATGTEACNSRAA
jgi:hypothetical protein